MAVELQKITRKELGLRFAQFWDGEEETKKIAAFLDYFCRKLNFLAAYMESGISYKGLDKVLLRALEKYTSYKTREEFFAAMRRGPGLETPYRLEDEIQAYSNRIIGRYRPEELREIRKQMGIVPSFWSRAEVNENE